MAISKSTSLRGSSEARNAPKAADALPVAGSSRMLFRGAYACPQLFDRMTCPRVEKYGEAVSGVRVGAVRDAKSCTIRTHPPQAIKASLGGHKRQAHRDHCRPMGVEGNVACIEANAACDNLSCSRGEHFKGFRRLDSRPNNDFASDGGARYSPGPPPLQSTLTCRSACQTGSFVGRVRRPFRRLGDRRMGSRCWA